MKTYFEPKMNISVFDKADVVTTSDTGTSTGNNFYRTTFSNLRDSGSDTVTVSAEERF